MFPELPHDTWLILNICLLGVALVSYAISRPRWLRHFNVALMVNWGFWIGWNLQWLGCHRGGC